MRSLISIVVILAVISGLFLLVNFYQDRQPSRPAAGTVDETAEDQTEIDELVESVRQDPNDQPQPQSDQPSQAEIQKLLLQANVNEAYLGRQPADKVDFTEVRKSYQAMTELADECDELNLYFFNLEQHNPTMNGLLETLPFKDDGGAEFFLSDNYDLMDIVFKNLPSTDEYARWYKQDFTTAQIVVEKCAE